MNPNTLQGKRKNCIETAQGKLQNIIKEIIWCDLTTILDHKNIFD